MKKITPFANFYRSRPIKLLLFSCLLGLSGCFKELGEKALKDFDQVNLVANKTLY